MARYIMALDAGTTSNRCILFDAQGYICSMAQKAFRQIFPKPGWVEHDPNEIWSTQLGVAVEALNKIGADASDIAAIGVTNQRETTLLWDRKTGEPLHPAIVWQCRRTAPLCDALRAQGLVETFQAKTGLVLDAYFSATKLRWLLDHIPGAQARAERGELCFGTVDSWLIWKLSKGRLHITDYANASRTLLFNIHSLDWDEDLLRLLRIPRAILPEVKPCSAVYGMTDPAYFGQAIPIAGSIGDQQAALFGQGCFEAGEAKNTYGTGCFLLMNTGNQPLQSQNGLVTTLAWGLGGQVIYALEGSIFIAGAAVQWLRDELRIIDSAPDAEWMALSVQDTHGCYVVPAFAGLGAPYWDPYARGAIVGLTRGVNKKHLVRAVLESIAYQTRDVLKAMEEDSGYALRRLQVDGGASMNRFLLQFQADILPATVCRPACIETTAKGAAFMAGLAVGFWPDLASLKALGTDEAVFEPHMIEADRQRACRGWKRAVKASFDWAREDEMEEEGEI